MTTAETISKRFGDDGGCFKDKDDVDILDVCRAEKRANGGDEDWESGQKGMGTVRFCFADSSVITIADGGWDIGYAGCYCWYDAGHVDDCPNAAEK